MQESDIKDLSDRIKSEFEKLEKLLWGDNELHNKTDREFRIRHSGKQP